MTDPNKIDEKLFEGITHSLDEAYTYEFNHTDSIQGGGDVQLVWQRTYVASMLAVSASIAVDAGLTAEQFAGFAFKAYEQAYKNAPRFG